LCSFATGVPVVDVALTEAKAIALKNGSHDVGQGIPGRNSDGGFWRSSQQEVTDQFDRFLER
jgi:hypothetical protein